MEQHRQSQVARYRNRARRYRRQRDMIIVISLIVLLASTVIHQVIFDKQADNFDAMEEIVEQYRERCDSYSKQIIDLTEQVQMLEYENSRMQQDEDQNTQLYFVPDDWTLDTKQAAKIYKSVPLDKDLQEYTWQLCVYLGIPECYETCLAIMWQETNFDPTLVSKTDDYGLMQINRCNIKSMQDLLGITDIMQIDQNICSGVYIFYLNYEQFDRDIGAALMAYNLGPQATNKCLAAGIYSTDYSRSVISKTQMILQDEYDANLA